MKPLLVTIDEAGRVCGVGRATIYRLIDSGHLERVKSGRRALVTVESIEAYVQQLRGGDHA